MLAEGLNDNLWVISLPSAKKVLSNIFGGTPGLDTSGPGVAVWVGMSVSRVNNKTGR